MNKPLRFFIAAVVFLSLYVIAAMVHPVDAFLLEPSKPGTLDDNWQTMSVDGVVRDDMLSLPVKLDTPAGEPVVLSTILPEAFNRSQNLLIRSSLQALEVRLDGIQVYQVPFENHPIGFMPYASVWNLVSLPSDAAGKTLTLVISSPFRQMSGRINPIQYGQKDTLLLYIMTTYGSTVFFILFLLFAGVVMFVLLTVSRSLRAWPMMYLGGFSILIGVWISAESHMLQFFTGNQFIHASLAYVSIALIPIPMVNYIREIVSARYQRVLLWLKHAYYGNFLLIVLLQAFSLFAFFETIVLTHAAILIGIGICLYVILQETVKGKNRDALMFLLSFSVIPMFGLAEMVLFYTSDFSKTSSLVRIGLLLFILLQSIHIAAQIRRNWEKSRKADLYRELAYTDSLTLSPNRQAFERDLHRAFANKNIKTQLWIGIFDLNNLKLINDHHGHATGDEALRRVFQIINAVCSADGQCYRIGGDEFACLLQHKDTDTRRIRELASAIDRMAEEYRQTVDYPFEIALGFELCHAEDETPEKAFQLADQAMYRDKSLKKSLA